MENDGLRQLPNDWYPLGLPHNVELAKDAYLDSSYGFAAFDSEQSPGLVLGPAAGAYNRATFIVGPRGKVTVGDFTILNETYVICQDRIEIGAHCLLSWGVVLTDSWSLTAPTAEARRAALLAAAANPGRHPPAMAQPQAVILEDNVWVGFDAVILAGVRLGQGCVVGCKTVVAENVPPYAIIAGDPARIIRHLHPDDSAEARAQALRHCTELR